MTLKIKKEGRQYAKNMNIKAIFFDIDGTLFNGNGSVLASTKRAIALAQAQGILCGVATGRGYPNVLSLVGELGLDFYVTYNGQYVVYQNRVIHAHPFNEEALNQVISYAKLHHKHILFGAGEKMTGSLTMLVGQSKRFAKLLYRLPKGNHLSTGVKLLKRLTIRRKRRHYPQSSDFKEPIYQCILMASRSELTRLKESLTLCDIQRSTSQSVDIVPKGGSKDKGIVALVNYLGLTMHEVAAFGDYFNDIDMLKSVGLGVAMGNAKKQVKEIADYVTADNNHDGIYLALKHFNII